MKKLLLTLLLGTFLFANTDASKITVGYIKALTDFKIIDLSKCESIESIVAYAEYLKVKDNSKTLPLKQAIEDNCKIKR